MFLPASIWVRMHEWSFVWIQDGSVWIQHGRVQDVWYHQVEWEWMSLSQIELLWVRVLCNIGWIQDGRIQDGCHYLVSWSELIWVRVRMEWECFWVNLREDNKVSESKMAVSESNMAEFRMAAIIKLSQNEHEWSFFCANSGWIQDSRIQDVSDLERKF